MVFIHHLRWLVLTSEALCGPTVHYKTSSLHEKVIQDIKEKIRKKEQDEK